MATIESLVNLKRSGNVYIDGGMKRHGDEEETWQRQTNLTRSEVERIISNKVEAALVQSDIKMKNLMERIALVNSEPQYDARIKKLDGRARKIKRRGDVAFAYIRKLRSVGVSHSPSPPPLSPAPSQPERCISPDEPIINMSRCSVNGGSFSDNPSISSAVNDCVVSRLRRPKQGFWQSLWSTKQFVDLTEEDEEVRLNEESPVTQQPDQKLVPSKPSSMPPKAIKKEGVMEAHRVTSPVQLEKEVWHSKLHPFPETPFPKELPVIAASRNLPQKPVVKLARIGNAQELGIAWNVERKDPQAAEMDCYYIYVSHEHKNGNFSEWKCLGVIKATPLPMACKVSDCKRDKRLCFIVVGKDVFGRYGLYSDVRTVAPGQM